MDIFANENAQLLIRAILSLESEAECRDLLADILTTKEVIDLGQRIAVAKLLREGKNYNRIIELSGASSTTISRVSHCLTYGSGGYNRALERIEGA